MPISSTKSPTTAPKTNLWLPKQVLVTPAAYAEDWGQQIIERVKSFDIPIKKLSQNRITGLRGKNERETYAIAKNTLAIVNAPPSQLKLTPIPPSADWQFHLAQGLSRTLSVLLSGWQSFWSASSQGLWQLTANFGKFKQLRG